MHSKFSMGVSIRVDRSSAAHHTAAQPPLSLAYWPAAPSTAPRPLGSRRPPQVRPHVTYHTYYTHMAAAAAAAAAGLRRVLYAACTDADVIRIFDRSADGQLRHREDVGCAAGPMWLCTDPQQRRLYCCLLGSNAIAAFAIDQVGAAPHLRPPNPPFQWMHSSPQLGTGSPVPAHRTF